MSLSAVMKRTGDSPVNAYRDSETHMYLYYHATGSLAQFRIGPGGRILAHDTLYQTRLESLAVVDVSAALGRLEREEVQ